MLDLSKRMNYGSVHNVLDNGEGRSFMPYGYFEDGYYTVHKLQIKESSLLISVKIYRTLLKCATLNLYEPMDLIWTFLAFCVISTFLLLDITMTIQGGNSMHEAAIALLESVGAVVGIHLVFSVLKGNRIETLVECAIANTRSKQKVKRDTRYILLLHLALFLVVGGFAVVPKCLRARALVAAQPTHTLAALSNSRAAVGMWEVCGALVTVWSVAGLTVFSTLTCLHAVRVASCFRHLMKASTPLEEGTARVLDIDVSVAHFGNRSTFDATVIGLCYLLKFILHFIFEVSSSVHSDALETGSAGYLAKNIVQPAVLFLFFLVPPGILNAFTDYLRKGVSRFFISQRHQPKEVRDAAKDLLAYVKESDMCVRVAGIKVSLADAYKMLVLAWSAYIAVRQVNQTPE